MTEILIILVIAVIVIGPKQLPQVAKAMGKMVTQFRRATSDLRNTISEEVNEHVPMDDLKEIKSSLESDLHSLERDSKDYLEEEFDTERQIGGGVARDFRNAMDDLPSREFDLDADNGGDPDKKKSRAKTAAKPKKKSKPVTAHTAAAGKSSAAAGKSNAAAGKSNAAEGKSSVGKVSRAKPATAKRGGSKSAAGKSAARTASTAKSGERTRGSGYA
ncbi:MAG: twin-arginine translocase TatA/TatE family subunit [SAR324 cluster bacterium]|nr:twin-arginine translocase TatA/TatE family subunit [SAR324 cluster bacterium]